MKNSNLIKFFAIILFFQFLSCSSDNEKTEIDQDQASILNDIKVSNSFILPFGMDNLDETEFSNYMKDISSTEFEKLQKNYTLKLYLLQINKLDLFKENMQKGDLYTDLILANFLTLKEFSELKKFNPDQLDDVNKVCGSSCTLSQRQFTCISGHGCRKAKFKIYNCHRDCTSDGGGSYTKYVKDGCC